jgi:hypothetical protein
MIIASREPRPSVPAPITNTNGGKSMGAIMVPILPGKQETWQEFMGQLENRNGEFQDFNTRMGLTRHRAWLQSTPDGGSVVIALHEGPGADSFMSKLAASDHPFDVEFKSYLADVHGLDFSADLPPMPKLFMDAGA